MARPRVLFICADFVGEEMAGVGIRAYELARALEPYADVRLAAHEARTATLPDMDVIPFHRRDPRALKRHIAEADFVVAQPQWPTAARWLRNSPARLIFDLYDPEPFEVLEWLGSRPLTSRAVNALTLDRVIGALRAGHHFICASEKQRDMWIGTMLAERLIRPDVYRLDPSMREFIDIVPFGLPVDQPVRSGSDGARAHFGLDAAAEVVLWNGGIWSWLDAESAVRAIGEVIKRRPTACLVFMGSASHGPGLIATQAARTVAQELGLLDRSVFFNDSWVPYERRADWLLDADCAISSHLDHLETRYAFRTRMLDCFWSGLPIVCTRGDDLADRVERDRLGQTAPPGDVRGLADGLEKVLANGRQEYADRLSRAAQTYLWPSVAGPLIRWITEPTDTPRLGASFRGGSSRRPPANLRDPALRASFALLNRLGLRDWPRL
jgi:glycosyltransferase involved in cell wall biosynthesis